MSEKLWDQEKAISALNHLVRKCRFDQQIYHLFDLPYFTGKKPYGKCLLTPEEMKLLSVDLGYLPNSRTKEEPSPFWTTPLLHFQAKQEIKKPSERLLQEIKTNKEKLLSQLHKCFPTTVCDQLDGFMLWLAQVNVNFNQSEILLPYFFFTDEKVTMNEFIEEFKKVSPLPFSVLQPRTWFSKRLSPTAIRIVPILFHLTTPQQCEAFNNQLNVVRISFQTVRESLASSAAQRLKKLKVRMTEKKIPPPPVNKKRKFSTYSGVANVSQDVPVR